MATSFPRFPALPRELRDTMWGFAAFETPHPVVVVGCKTSKAPITACPNVDTQLRRVSNTHSVCREARDAFERTAQHAKPTYWVRFIQPPLRWAEPEQDLPHVTQTSGTVVLDVLSQMPCTLKDYAQLLTRPGTLAGTGVKTIYLVCDLPGGMYRPSRIDESLLASIDDSSAAAVVERAERTAITNIVPVLRSVKHGPFRPPSLIQIPDPHLLGMGRQPGESLQSHLPANFHGVSALGGRSGTYQYVVVCTWDRDDALGVHAGLPQLLWLQLVQLRQTQMQNPLVAGLREEFPNLERVSVLMPKLDAPVFIGSHSDSDASRQIKVQHWSDKVLEEA